MGERGGSGNAFKWEYNYNRKGRGVTYGILVYGIHHHIARGAYHTLTHHTGGIIIKYYVLIYYIAIYIYCRSTQACIGIIMPT